MDEIRKVDDKNRIVLPEIYLHELGINNGDHVIVEKTKNTIVITKAKITKA